MTLMKVEIDGSGEARHSAQTESGQRESVNE